MDGVLRCSRYAFGPNRLHYCGPDANSELRSEIEHKEERAGLTVLLKEFQTLYPYLRHIAEANYIKDPFDSRVIEAYWLGNRLLEDIPAKKLHLSLIVDHSTKKKLGQKEFARLEQKIAQGAVPHHSFHVLNVWRRDGYTDVPNTVESLGECIITWGRVVVASGPSITVETEPLLYESGKLTLGAPVKRVLPRRLEAEYDIEQLKTGELVSIHWGVPCEVITADQLADLKRYTLQNIAFANQTI